jgi:hypothetical protein
VIQCKKKVIDLVSIIVILTARSTNITCPMLMYYGNVKMYLDMHIFEIGEHALLSNVLMV